MKPLHSSRTTLGDDNEQYRLLMESVTDYAIFLLDPDGRVATWNAGAERLFGYSEEEAVGMPIDRVFTPEDVEEGVAEQELETARATGRASDDRWHVKKDGSRFWVNGVSTALYDEDGRLRGFAKVCRDRTEQKRLEDELRRQVEQLAEADRKKDEFLALLGHELRNPLAPIQNAVQLLRRQGPEDPALAWSHDLIERQVGHLTRLVDDLLDVSRITRGKVKLQKERVELARVVGNAVETCGPLLSARQHRLDVSLTSEPVLLEADPTRLAQVVGNLLTNAARYTPEGGHIRLGAEQAGGEVVLRIADNGVGIRADFLPHIFDLFVQAEPSPHQAHGGLGLGLTLVKSLVEMHGGSVTAHSDGPGHGSEFVVRLPVAAQAQGTSGDASLGCLPPAPSRRILVVDDNVDAAESLAMVLQLEGHQVQTIYDGASALHAAGDFQPHVVLLDISLPGGLSGYDLAPRMRELPGLENALLVALTGFGQEEDKRRALSCGFHAHLTKPANLAELKAVLTAGQAEGDSEGGDTRAPRPAQDLHPKNGLSV